MGVKSTTTLTRQEAENKYVDLMKNNPATLRRWRAQAVLMTDKELEDELERLNDATFEDGQGGFDNYSISGK